MIKDFKTSQLIEYRKMLKIMYDGFSSAIQKRATLIDDTRSLSDYEHSVIDSFQDPEYYYSIKFLDKAITIVRLYNCREWFHEDEDHKYFHFAIRCYNFKPNDRFGLDFNRYADHTDYGDFQDINDTWKYIRVFANELICEVGKIVQSELIPMDIF